VPPLVVKFVSVVHKRFCELNFIGLLSILFSALLVLMFVHLLFSPLQS